MPAIVEPDPHPPSKRQKFNDTRQPLSPPARRSRIFAPFRTVGLVSPTAVPFAAQPLGKTTYHLTTSVGRCLQTYDLRKGLNLTFLTRPETPGPITAVASWADKVLAAWSAHDQTPTVWIFKRGKKVGELLLSGDAGDAGQDIVDISMFGSWIVACGSSAIHIWKSDTLEYYTTLSPPFKDSDAAILTGGITTMPTFANKIFAGRADGSVEIWNVSTGRLLYRILAPDSSAGAVSALQPSPALSLLAIAYANGLVVIHDVVIDRQVLRLNAGASPLTPVTSISFRTDGLGAGPDGQQSGVMATASFGSGDITFWDLNDLGRRMTVLRGAHDTTGQAADGGGVSKIEFLPGQAILASSGADNSLRTWIFDHTPFSSIPRMLHSRSGHGAPITTLTFLPTDSDGADFTGKWLLSSGKDRGMWAWSLRRDAQSTELSQGAVHKKAKRMGLQSSASETSTPSARSLKAPEIHCLACCLNRDGGMSAMSGDKTVWASAKQLKSKSTALDPNLTGWESVVTGHAGDKYARTWFWGRKRAGRWLLETGDGGEVKSVAMSPCGTFAVVGSADGGIDMFNLQSGQHRQRFPPRMTSTQAKKMAVDRANADLDGQFAGATAVGAKGTGKHRGPVTGIEVDGLNTYVISCGLDGRIKFWDFGTGRLLHEVDWHVSLSIFGMKLHRTSSLLALNCSDGCIRIIDIETRRVVREFRGPATQIKDYCFSNDGRWIVSGSADAVIRVWDLPTGHLIDAIRLRSSCSAVAFSDTGEFLATAQEDGVGIDLWTNRALFKHVPIQPLSEADVAVDSGPSASGERGQHILASALEDTTEELETFQGGGPLPVVEQLSQDVETLSLVPRTRWQNLLHLDAIRARNKPIEPPKAPEKAPFFLPSLLGINSDAEALASRISEERPSNRTTADAIENHTRSRIVKMDRISSQSRFASLLHAFGNDMGSASSHAILIEALKALSPSQADVEIRSLDATPPLSEPVWFVRALTTHLKQRRDYELIQAWMAVFLRCHGDLLAEDAEAVARGPLTDAISQWRIEQKREAKRLNEMAAYCAGVVGFLRNAR